MLTQLGQWLTAPIFADVEKTRQARMTTIMLRAIVVMVALLAPFSWVFLASPDPSRLLEQVIASIAIIVGAFTLHHLNQQGRVALVNFLLPTTLFILLSVTLFSFRPINLLRPALYIIVIIIAGLTLGQRGALGFAVASYGMALLRLFMVNLQDPTFVLGDAYLYFALTYLVLFVLTALLLSLATNNIQQGLITARRLHQLEIEAEHRHRELAESLREISLALNASLNLEAVLDLLLEQLARVVPYDTANVMLVNGSRASVARWRGYERFGEAVTNTVTNTTFEIAATYNLQRIVETRQPFIISDVSHEPAWVTLHTVQHIQSWLGAPIFAGDQIVAFFSLDKAEPGFYQPEHAEALGNFATQVGFAMQNARLYQQVSQRAAHLTALNTVIASSIVATDLPQLLETTLDNVLHALELSLGSVWLANHSVTRQGTLDLASHLRALATYPDGKLFSAFADLLQVSASLQELVEPLSAQQVRAVLSVPIKVEGQLLGALSVCALEARQWDPDMCQLLISVGKQLGAAAERLRLFEATLTRAQVMKRLASLSEALNRPLTLTEVIGAIGEGALALGNLSRAAIYLRQPDDSISIPWATGISDYYRDQILQKFPAVPGGQMLINTSPIIIADVSDLPDTSPLKQLAGFEAYRAVHLWPLVYEGRVLAAIGAYYDEPRLPSALEEEVLLAFARQAAVALANARLFEAEKNQRQLAEVLREISGTLNATLDLSQTLDQLLQELALLITYDSCAVMLNEGAYYQVVASQGFDNPEQVSQVQIPATNPLMMELRRVRQTVVIKDAQSDPRFERWGNAQHVRGWMGVPLISRKELIGVLTVDSRTLGAYGQHEAEIALVFANQAAIAIENARLHAAVKERVRELDVLLTAHSVLLSTLDLETLLRNILAAAIDAIAAAEKGSILLAAPDQNGLQIRATAGYTDQRVSQLQFTTAGYAFQAFRTNRPLLVTNCKLDPALNYIGEIREVREIVSAIAAPLKPTSDPATPLGVITLDATRENAFTEADLRLLSALANTAATAIENARLHAHIQTLAVTDGLTGLANHRAFSQALENEFARAERYGHPLSLIILDIDSFKKYNDTYGHPAGNERLKGVAQLLKDNVRDPDLAARYGGEEFALLLPHTHKAGALILAERIRSAAAASAPYALLPDEHLSGYTLSLGVATYPEDATTVEALTVAADDAEIAAKRAGKNRVVAAMKEGSVEP